MSTLSRSAARPVAARPPQAASAQAFVAAAQALDLGLSRRLVYVGGDVEPLVAFLHTWPQLAGTWLVPDAALDGAHRSLGLRALDGRVRCVAGDSFDAVPPGDVVLLSAVDAAVEQSLQLLLGVRRGWLPALARWLILQCESPHPSCLIDAPLLASRGLRVANRLPLPAGLQMLACARAHEFTEMLSRRAERGDVRPAPGSLQGRH